MRFIKYVFIFASFSFLVNCGEVEKKDEKKSVKIGASKEVKKKDSNSVNIGLTGNDMMQFSTNELKVKACVHPHKRCKSRLRSMTFKERPDDLAGMNIEVYPTRD